MTIIFFYLISHVGYICVNKLNYPLKFGMAALEVAMCAKKKLNKINVNIFLRAYLQ